MRTDVKPTNRLGPRQFEACAALTFGRNNGRMWHRLNNYIHRDVGDTAVRLLVDRKLVAWALVFPNNWDNGRMTAYFYVHPAYRRQGYGTVLRNIVTKRWGPNVVVYRHNEEATAFFNATDPQGGESVRTETSGTPEAALAD